MAQNLNKFKGVKVAGDTQVPAIFRASNSGLLEDSAANGFGKWITQKALPKVINPVMGATKAVETPMGTVPGWANALATGGVGGALAGGLWNKFVNKGTFGRGAAWGAGIGAAGLGALGHVTSGKDWLQRTPILKMFATPPKSNIAGHRLPMGPGGSIGNKTNDEIRGGLPAKSGSLKEAAWGQSGGANISTITRKIFQDTKLTLMQKQELTNQVKYLNAQQASKLNMLVGSAWGGGVGLVIAKYLLGLGKFGTILTTIASGLLGASMSRGQAPKPTHDKYGTPYYM